MTKDEKLNSIIKEYWHSDLTLYEALDKAYITGRLQVVAKYQIDIDNQIDKINSVLETIHEIANGK